jgi:hypothetical protein
MYPSIAANAQIAGRCQLRPSRSARQENSSQDQHQPDPRVHDEQSVAVIPAVVERIEHARTVGIGKIEQRMAEKPGEATNEKTAELHRIFFAWPQLFPDENNCSRKQWHCDQPAGPVGEAAVRCDRLGAKQRCDEAVDVGQVGRDDQRGHGARSQALEAHAAEKSADQAVGEIVH